MRAGTTVPVLFRRLVTVLALVTTLTAAVMPSAREVPTAGAATQAGSAVALLYNAGGEFIGLATLSQTGDRAHVQVEVFGLPPGFHGFHMHAVGACDAGTSAPFTSAGGHINPDGRDHGHHAGDMPVLYVQADGAGTLSFITDRLAVVDLFDADGSAVIVHADPDNFGNIPPRYAAAPDATTLSTGDAGARIACGVIAPAE